MVSIISLPSGSAHIAKCGFLWCVLGWAQNRTARGAEEIASREEIANLKAQTCPCPFALAAAVDSKRGTGDEQFGHDLGLPGNFGVKDGLVKSHGPGHVLRPNEVFEFLDVHGASIGVKPMRTIDPLKSLAREVPAAQVRRIRATRHNTAPATTRHAHVPGSGTKGALRKVRVASFAMKPPPSELAA
jgi:hypothetical protein